MFVELSLFAAIKLAAIITFAIDAFLEERKAAKRQQRKVNALY